MNPKSFILIHYDSPFLWTDVICVLWILLIVLTIWDVASSFVLLLLTVTAIFPILRVLELEKQSKVDSSILRGFYMLSPKEAINTIKRREVYGIMYYSKMRERFFKEFPELFL